MTHTKLPSLLAAVVFCAAGSLHAGTSPDVPGSATILLGIDGVRKCLALSAAQASGLDEIRSDYRADARRLTAKPTPDAASRCAAEKKLVALTRKYDARALAVLTPDQKTRLAKIEHHKLGGTILLSTKVQKELALTDAQIAKIKKIHDDGLLKCLNEKFANADIGHQERLDALRLQRLRQADAMENVLTPQQRKTFQALSGRGHE